MARRIVTLIAGLGIAVGVLVVTPAAASAQTSPTYPGQCDVTTSSASGGTASIGQTFVITLAPTCVWTPGSAVTVTVNGVAIPGKVANASGVVTVTITVLSATQFSVDDPVLVASQCGRNTVLGVGDSEVAGARVSHTVTFNVDCPAATAQPSRGAVAFTGANVVKWSAAAAVLVGAGFGLMVFSRRRRRS